MFRKIIILAMILTVAVSCKKESSGPDFSAIDKEIIGEYLTLHNLTAQTTSSGLYYMITAPGTGAHPTITSSVTANYKGYLPDGTVFDQTTTTPATFQLSGVIPGWQEGLQLIGAGGKIKLLIPSRLGYGDQVVGSIPRNSVLIFDVQLLSIN